MGMDVKKFGDKILLQRRYYYACSNAVSQLSSNKKYRLHRSGSYSKLYVIGFRLSLIASTRQRRIY
jgi:hypothetical protein